LQALTFYPVNPYFADAYFLLAGQGFLHDCISYFFGQIDLQTENPLFSPAKISASFENGGLTRNPTHASA